MVIFGKAAIIRLLILFGLHLLFESSINSSFAQVSIIGQTSKGSGVYHYNYEINNATTRINSFMLDIHTDGVDNIRSPSGWLGVQSKEATGTRIFWIHLSSDKQSNVTILKGFSFDSSSPSSDTRFITFVDTGEKYDGVTVGPYSPLSLVRFVLDKQDIVIKRSSHDSYVILEASIGNIGIFPVNIRDVSFKLSPDGLLLGDKTLFSSNFINQFPISPQEIYPRNGFLPIYTIKVPANISPGKWEGDLTLFGTSKTEMTESLMTNPARFSITVRNGISGDLNVDWTVNLQDVTLSLRIALGLITPSDDQQSSGDINGDGKLNLSDTTLILRMAIGL